MYINNRNKYIIIFSAFFIVYCNAANDYIQVSQWNITRNFYLYSSESVSLGVAEQRCNSQGAMIATISSEAEAIYLYNQLALFKVNTSFWIGIRSYVHSYSYEQITQFPGVDMYNIDTDTCNTYCPWEANNITLVGANRAVLVKFGNGKFVFSTRDMDEEHLFLCVVKPRGNDILTMAQVIPTTGGRTTINPIANRVTNGSISLTKLNNLKVQINLKNVNDTYEFPPGTGAYRLNLVYQYSPYTNVSLYTYFQYSPPTIIGIIPNIKKGEKIYIRGSNLGYDTSLISLSFGENNVQCLDPEFYRPDQLSCILKDNIQSIIPITITVDGITSVSYNPGIYTTPTTNYLPPQYSVFSLGTTILPEFFKFFSNQSFEEIVYLGSLTHKNQFDLISKLYTSGSLVQGYSRIGNDFVYKWGPSKNQKLIPFYFGDDATMSSDSLVSLEMSIGALINADYASSKLLYLVEHSTTITPSIVSYSTNASNVESGYVTFEMNTVAPANATLSDIRLFGLYGIVVLYKDNLIVARVPAGMKYITLYMRINNVETNLVLYRNNIFKPLITNYTTEISKGQFGNITINGNYFQSDSIVSIGNIQCKSVEYISISTLVCNYDGNPVINGNDALPINVTNNGGETINYIFYYKQYFECINPSCSGNGQCNHENGQCQCNPGYHLVDCSFKSVTSAPPPLVNNNGGAVLTTSNNPSVTTKFNIDIQFIREIDPQGNTVKLVNVSDINWSAIKPNNESTTANGNTTFLYNGKINNESLSIDLKINIFKESDTIEFAGEQIRMEPNSVKFQVKLNGWSFQDRLNSLDFVYASQFIQDDFDDSCLSDTDLQYDSDTNMTWYQVKIGSSILSARFARYIYLNGRITKSKVILLESDTDPLYKLMKDANQQQKENQFNYLLLTAIQIPYFDSDCILDPNFSVLVTSDQNSCKEKNNWKLPVIVVCSVVSAFIVIVSVALLTKKILKGRRLVDVAKKAVKMQKMNEN